MLHLVARLILLWYEVELLWGADLRKGKLAVNRIQTWILTGASLHYRVEYYPIRWLWDHMPENQTADRLLLPH